MSKTFRKNIPYKFKTYSEQYDCYFTLIPKAAAEYIFPPMFWNLPKTKNIKLFIDPRQFVQEFIIKYGDG